MSITTNRSLRVFPLVAGLALFTLLACSLHLLDQMIYGFLHHGLPGGRASVSRIRLIVPAGWTLTAFFASGLALWLLHKGRERDDIRALIVFLLASAFFQEALVVLLYNRALYLPDWMQYVFIGSAVGGLWFALAAFLRFSTLFPVPLKKTDIPTPPRAVSSEGRLGRVRRAVVGSGVSIQRAALIPWVPWVAALVIALLPLPVFFSHSLEATTSSLNLWLGIAEVVGLVFIAVALPVGIVNLRTGLRMAGDTLRRSDRAVSLGFQVMGTLLACGLSGFLLALVLGKRGEWLASVGLIASTAVFPILVLTLMLAVLRAGALVSAAAVRRVAVVGAVLAVTFLGFEKLIEAVFTKLISRLGLAEAITAIMTTALIVLAFGHVRPRVERWIRRTTSDPDPFQQMFLLASDLVDATVLFEAQPKVALRIVEAYYRVGESLAKRGVTGPSKLGDRLIIPFWDANAVVDVCLAFPSTFVQHLREHTLSSPKWRLAVTVGRSHFSSDTGLQGEAVIDVMRLLAKASPGETLVSRAACESIDDPRIRLELVSEEAGDCRLLRLSGGERVEAASKV